MPWGWYNAPPMQAQAQPWLMGRGGRNMGAPLYPPGNNGSKGKGKAKAAARARAKDGKGKGLVDPAAEANKRIAQLEHTNSQLRANAAALKAAGKGEGAAQEQEGEPETPGDTWLCFGCQTEHTNMSLLTCRNKTCNKKRNNQPQPAEAVVVVRNWGPFAEKDAQKLLKTVGAPPVLTVSTPEADGQDGANNTLDNQQANEQAAQQCESLLAWMALQPHCDQELKAATTAKLAKLKEPQAGAKGQGQPGPHQLAGRLQNLLGRQQAHHTAQAEAEATALEAAEQEAALATAAVTTLRAQQETDQNQRRAVLAALREERCKADEAATKQDLLDGVAPATATDAMSGTGPGAPDAPDAAEPPKIPAILTDTQGWQAMEELLKQFPAFQQCQAAQEFAAAVGASQETYRNKLAQWHKEQQDQADAGGKGKGRAKAFTPY